MSTSGSRPCFRSTRCLHSSPARALYRYFTTSPSNLEPKPHVQLPSTSPHPPRELYIPLSSLSYHWDTLPPTPSQLKHASQFFTRQPPTFLWSAPKFKTMDFDSSPEVCFLGRSNVGKSSLLNALLNKKIAHASSRPGRTRSMNAFAVGGEDDMQRRLVVMDMPGYGKGGREEWGIQIMKYIEKRRELKRVFVLVDALHGVKESDRQIVQMLKGLAVPYQVVLSKVDRVLFDGSKVPSDKALEGRLMVLRRRMEEIRELVRLETEEDGGSVGEVIACSAEKRLEGKLLGIDALRFAMLHAAGLELIPNVKLAAPVEVVPFEEIFGKDGE